jgi:hypothetical protein
VAGMLALESRASAGVGVAISVTTIPAAAYLGVAAGLGELGKVTGALAVLAVNVVMIQAGGRGDALAAAPVVAPPPTEIDLITRFGRDARADCAGSSEHGQRWRGRVNRRR